MKVGKLDSDICHLKGSYLLSPLEEVRVLMQRDPKKIYQFKFMNDYFGRYDIQIDVTEEPNYFYRYFTPKTIKKNRSHSRRNSLEGQPAPGGPLNTGLIHFDDLAWPRLGRSTIPRICITFQIHPKRYDFIYQSYFFGSPLTGNYKTIKHCFGIQIFQVSIFNVKK